MERSEWLTIRIMCYFIKWTNKDCKRIKIHKYVLKYFILNASGSQYRDVVRIGIANGLVFMYFHSLTILVCSFIKLLKYVAIILKINLSLSHKFLIAFFHKFDPYLLFFHKFDPYLFLYFLILTCFHTFLIIAYRILLM